MPQPKYQNPIYPPTAGRNGWTNQASPAFPASLSPAPVPGGVPIIDGMPAGPPVPGWPPNSKVGVNPYGPQPITGLGPPRDANGTIQGGYFGVTPEEATAWWNSAQVPGAQQNPQQAAAENVQTPWWTRTPASQVGTNPPPPTTTGVTFGTFDMAGMMNMMMQMMPMMMQMRMMNMMMEMLG